MMSTKDQIVSQRGNLQNVFNHVSLSFTNTENSIYFLPLRIHSITNTLYWERYISTDASPFERSYEDRFLVAIRLL